MKRLLAWFSRRPAACPHDWRYTGPTGTGWLIARCALCGKTDLA